MGGLLCRDEMYTGQMILVKEFKKLIILVVVIQVAALYPRQLFAIEDPGPIVNNIQPTPVLGNVIDMNLKFSDETGNTRALSEIIDPEKPIILTPVYFDCPRLCGLLLSGVVKLLNELELVVGSDYQILSISFDHTETPQMAYKRSVSTKAQVAKNSEKLNAWHFLVGTQESVTALMNQIGFKYSRDGSEFVHSAVIMILTPQGKISQYFGGIDFTPRDVRLALVESSQGKIGSLIDQFFLFCFRYDHSQGKYAWAVFNLLRVGGLLTLVGLALVIVIAGRQRI